MRTTRGVAVRSAVVVLIAVPTLVLASAPARAGTIHVTTTADEAGTGPACSLREAILSANGDTAVGGCTAGSAATTDLISLPAGDYGLATGGTNEDAAADGDLDVTRSVIVQGAGAAVTVVDGNGSVGGERVFQVFAPSVLTISGLTVYDGRDQSGGGILNLSGTVELRHSRVSGNLATSNGGGIGNFSGTVHLADSTVEGNRSEFGGGGGIANISGSTLSLTNSAVSGNTADTGLGGGIDNGGSTITITRSSVSGNDALGDLGGGIFNGQNTHLTIVGSWISGNHAAASGGGILHNGGTLAISASTVSGNSTGNSGGGIALASTTTITDSTISGNRAAVDGGGMQSLGGQTVDIENTTITANLADWDDNGTGDGGGVARGAGNVSLANTLLARNVDAGGEAPDCTGTLGTVGFNLIGANTACVASAGTGDQLGTVAAPIDPRLAPLADNGGSTDTHALLPGSPAVHAGSPLQPGGGGGACTALDQRGVPRSSCDIGAYQLVRCFGWPVTVVGTPAGDVLRGTGAGEAFLAMGGNDLIQAGGGGDRVCAGPGADRVFGEGGDDLLAGGAGPDSLDGGSGTDLCQGGPGPDTAVRCERTTGV